METLDHGARHTVSGAFHTIAIHGLWRGKRCFSSINYCLV